MGDVLTEKKIAYFRHLAHDLSPIELFWSVSRHTGITLTSRAQTELYSRLHYSTCIKDQVKKKKEKHIYFPFVPHNINVWF